MPHSGRSILVVPDATPRKDPARYEPIQWPTGERVQLSPRSAALNIDLVNLLEQRQTRRIFSRELSIDEIGDFLWLGLREINTFVRGVQFAREMGTPD